MDSGHEWTHRLGRCLALPAGRFVALTAAALVAGALVLGVLSGSRGGVARARLARAGVAVGTRNAVAADQLSDLAPLAPGAFDRPIAEDRSYAERWAVRLSGDVAALTTALRHGHRAGARRAWMTAFSDYLHLGAVYGFLPPGLNDQLAQVPPERSDDDFPGVHRIEKGLWTGQALGTLVPVSMRVSRAVTVLRHVLGSEAISPLDDATRAHEILEDAQRDLMSGTSVPWSGAGVLGTAAALAATQNMISTLVPLLDGRDDTLAVTEYWLWRFQRVIGDVRRPDGTYPSLRQLSHGELERIDGTLAGTLGALSQVPGTLETTPIPSIPALAVAAG